MYNEIQRDKICWERAHFVAGGGEVRGDLVVHGVYVHVFVRLWIVRDLCDCHLRHSSRDSGGREQGELAEQDN